MKPTPSTDLAAALSADEVAQTTRWVLSHQQPSGEILWVAGGKSDPWDHVHAAMGLVTSGELAAARAAYRFMAATQEPNGAWAAERVNGKPTRITHETNHAAYIATGLWHLFCADRDEAFLAEMWPAIDRAIEWVVRLQLPTGAIAWAEKAGKAWPSPLVTGSSSIHGSLVCAIRIANQLGHDRSHWRAARRRLARVLRHNMGIFSETDLPEGPGRYSMDWYYPVLGGAIRGAAARERLLESAESRDFVRDEVGCRCVREAPWYTVAETCELVLALDACGLTSRARSVLSWTKRQRTDNGAYWTGATHPEGIVFPEGEQTTWTAAAVLVANDALYKSSATSDFFTRLDGADLDAVHVDSPDRAHRHYDEHTTPAE
jgi:hypothetical protein